MTRVADTTIQPEPLNESELNRIQQESDEQMQRARRSVWLSVLLGLSMGSVLLTWAILGPSLSNSVQVIFGIVVAIEATAMGFALSVYARVSQIQVLKHYLNRMRDLALRLQETSVRDSLTGLYNHGYLLTRLQEEISRAARHQHTLSLIIIDLNKFKEVNDHHGHLMGDQLLQLVAAAIRQQVRQHDIVARYGGDEFCLILPETDRQGSEEVVEKLRSGVDLLCQEMEDWTGDKISFGCGISSFPEDGATAHALIAAADAQLYEEKDVQRLERAREHGTNVHNLFYRIGEAVAQSIDPTERLNRLTAAVGTALNLQAAAILWDEDGKPHAAAHYFADPEFGSAIRRLQAEAPLTSEEAPDLLAVRQNEVNTREHMTAKRDFPERFAAIMPPDLWSQWTPISIPERPPAVLVLVGKEGEASPPEPALARALVQLLGGAIQSSLNYQEARRHGEHLAALADVGSLLLMAAPFEERLRRVAQRVVEAVGFDAVTIATDDPGESDSILTSTYSLRSQHLADEWERTVREQPAQFTKQLKDAFATLREPIVIDEPADHALVVPFLRKIFGRGQTRSLLILPLRVEDHAVGAMAVISSRPKAFDSDTILLFRAIASQIASSTQVALLFQEVQDSYQELQQAHLDAMSRLAAVAEARDVFTGSHLHRLRALAEAIGRRLGLSEDEIVKIGHASVVHDIGKLRIPDSVLAKPGALSEEEWALIRKHPVYGEVLLGEHPFYQKAREVIRWHHERWDGSGYPDGLKGEAIPPIVRIVSVADVFDALTSQRPYKDAWPVERAVAYVRDERGKHFAPEVVDAFIALAEDGTLETIVGAMADAGQELSATDERFVA